MTAQECPSGCGRTQPAGKFLCSKCWAEVPRHLQRDVYRTWRALSRETTSENVRAYRLAREAALSAVV